MRDYIAISKDRNKAFDITNAHNHGWGADNISGFERRAFRSLGIRNLHRKLLHEILKNNFYLEKGAPQQSFQVFLGENLRTKYDNLFIFKGKFANIRNLAIRFGIDKHNYDIVEKSDGTGYDIVLYVNKTEDKFIRLINNQVVIHNFEAAEVVIQQVVRFFRTFNKQSEGFHLIEHILLREDTTYQGVNDPYSFIMTMVFPSWPIRFQSTDFRNLIHEFIIQESPTHVFVNVLWLGFEDMEVFEKTYKEWLQLKTSLEAHDPRLINASKKLMGLIMMYSEDQV